MNNNCSKKFWGGRAAYSISRGVLAALAVLAVSGIASAQDKKEGVSFSSISSPTTPTAITPEAGNTAFLVGHAFGTQGYVCTLDPVHGGTSWTVNNARPEATLFTNAFGQPFQIITHFQSINANPKPGVSVPLGGNVTWQSSFDTSKVWAKAIGMVKAGDDPDSCPNSGSIPCVLLQSIGNQEGPTGGKLLANVTFIQRLNTKGGAAPTDVCSDGQTQLQPYTADYFFYRAAE